jgi:hypothetical protein
MEWNKETAKVYSREVEYVEQSMQAQMMTLILLLTPSSTLVWMAQSQWFS